MTDNTDESLIDTLNDTSDSSATGDINIDELKAFLPDVSSTPTSKAATATKGKSSPADLMTAFLNSGKFSEEEQNAIELVKATDADTAKLTAAQAIIEGIKSGREDVKTARGKQEDLVKKAQGIQESTQNQQMIEGIAAGLIKALSGVVANKQGWTSNVDIKPTDFQALLANRLKTVGMEQDLAKEEYASKQQLVRERIAAADATLKWNQLSPAQKANAVFQTMVRKQMADQAAAERASQQKQLSTVQKLEYGRQLISGLDTVTKERSTQLNRANQLMINAVDGKDANKAKAAQETIIGMYQLPADSSVDYIRSKLNSESADIKQHEENVGAFRTGLINRLSAKVPPTADELTTMDFVKAGIKPEPTVKTGLVAANNLSNMREVYGAVKADPTGRLEAELKKQLPSILVQAKASTSFIPFKTQEEKRLVDALETRLADKNEKLTYEDLELMNRLPIVKTEDGSKITVMEAIQRNEQFLDIRKELTNLAIKAGKPEIVKQLSPNATVGIGSFVQPISSTTGAPQAGNDRAAAVQAAQNKRAEETQAMRDSVVGAMNAGKGDSSNKKETSAGKLRVPLFKDKQ
jgi:hypothetical protein